MFAVPVEESNLKMLFSIVRLVITWQCLWIYPLDLNTFYFFCYKLEMIAGLRAYVAVNEYEVCIIECKCLFVELRRD